MQAYLPAQDIKDGLVTMAVIEGCHRKIDLRNRSNLSNVVTRDTLGKGAIIVLAWVPAGPTTVGQAIGSKLLHVYAGPISTRGGLQDEDNMGAEYDGTVRFYNFTASRPRRRKAPRLFAVTR